MIYLSKKAAEKCRGRYAFSDIPDINIISNREACITGTKSITEYTQEHIRLDCGYILITVKGSCLNMTALSVEEVIIKGELLSLEFSYYQR